MQLIYRAHTLNYVPAPQRSIQPRAINWRYRVFEDVTTDVATTPVVKAAPPRAINWRYQVVSI